MQLTRRLVLFFLVTGIFFVTTQTVSAQELPENIVICGNEGQPMCEICDVVKLGMNVLNFFVFFSLIFATLLFINAGVLYLFSPANPGNISRAHKIFTNTLIGILFVLTAWLVVNTIMSNLYGAGGSWGPWNKILCGEGSAKPPKAPTTPPAPSPPPPTAGEPTECSAIRSLTSLTDQLAIRMEGGDTLIWEGTRAPLQACAEKFARSVGGTVTSAYRPQQYQQHLWEIRDRWCTQGLRFNTDPACSTLKSSILEEVTQHFGSNWDCGAVGATSRHTSGTAVDIGGINNYAAVADDARKLCLEWRNYPGDPYHYDLLLPCNACW